MPSTVRHLDAVRNDPAYGRCASQIAEACPVFMFIAHNLLNVRRPLLPFDKEWGSAIIRTHFTVFRSGIPRQKSALRLWRLD
jgi:hypothetical protein